MARGHPAPLLQNQRSCALQGLFAPGRVAQQVTLAEIAAQGWSLNPGRYVGLAPGEDVSDEDFNAQFEALNEELVTLNAQARELEQTIAANVAEIFR